MDKFFLVSKPLHVARHSFKVWILIVNMVQCVVWILQVNTLLLYPLYLHPEAYKYPIGPKLTFEPGTDEMVCSQH